MSAQFPAFVVDVGAGADFTIFSVVHNKIKDARERAIAYCDKYLRPKQISHAIYLLDTQKDFDRIIAKHNINTVQAKVWRIENELAQAKKELTAAYDRKEALE